MQVVLLRFLETGEIQRIGADRSHTRVNVRLITATNRDPPKEMPPATSARTCSSASMSFG
jgi:transcriptional regulator with GAF, ATPase, and Fis domain